MAELSLEQKRALALAAARARAAQTVPGLGDTVPGTPEDEALKQQLQSAQRESFSDRLRREKPVTDTLLGAPETALSILTNALRSGLAGASALVSVPRGDQPLADRMAETVEHVEAGLPAFQPVSGPGQRTLARVQKPLADLAAESENSGSAALEATGSPAAATAVRMAPDAVLALTGGVRPSAVGAVKPRVPSKTTHTVDQTGAHIVKSDKGELLAQESGDALQIKRVDVREGERGKGYGQDLVESLIDEAHKQGKVVASDVTLSPDAVHMYEGLGRRGYQVERGATEASKVQEGGLVSTDPRVPIFKVGPKPALIPETKGASLYQEVRDLFTKGGPERILTRYQRRIIGDPKRQGQVVDALEGPGAQELVPGSKPTAAEALAKTPAGSPVLAHQNIVSKVSGGPSAAFGERIAAQEAARTRARGQVEKDLGPVRDEVLEAANAATAKRPTIRAKADGSFEVVKPGAPGGVPVATIQARIKALAETPELRAREVVEKTLANITDRLNQHTRGDKLIDANDLYSIRKDIGEMIQRNQPAVPGGKLKPGSKRLASSLERQVQLAIDEAIEAAGGKGWKKVMADYAARLQRVEADAARAKQAKKPTQRTNLAGPPIGQQAKPEVPNLLSRPAMLLNFFMRQAGRNVEPQIDALAAQRYLNPEQLAAALRGVQAATPKGPPRRYSAKGAAIADQAERARRLRAEALRQ